MGYRGRPLACRNASREELKAYCNALRERGKGAIEIAMTKQIGVMDDPELELLDFMLAESGAADHLHRHVRPRRHLGGGAHLAAQGARR